MTSKNNYKSNGMKSWILFVIAQLIYCMSWRGENSKLSKNSVEHEISESIRQAWNDICLKFG